MECQESRGHTHNCPCPSAVRLAGGGGARGRGWLSCGQGQSSIRAVMPQVHPHCGGGWGDQEEGQTAHPAACCAPGDCSLPHCVCKPASGTLGAGTRGGRTCTTPALGGLTVQLARHALRKCHNNNSTNNTIVFTSIRCLAAFMYYLIFMKPCKLVLFIGEKANWKRQRNCQRSN